ncbi:MAG: metal-sensitive transcriptional regulator [Anaerolineaceae bacterium]|nr:metal-sensitive transcriptional regulator [Anaerolineaceae bacterium]MBN2677234.1 metal-sensitive transcriptional regulator [Anaerolineaceae bacterium]
MHHPEALKRLKTVEGHIRGIQRMLEDDAYCIDIIKQIQAVQAALSKVNSLILDEHLDACLTTAVRGEDPVAREKVLVELSEVFSTRNRS